MNIRECKQCHRMVDFDEPWCDHETMEESAWLDIRRRSLAMPSAEIKQEIAKAYESVIDLMVEQVAEELGWTAGKAIEEKQRKLLDGENK